MFRLDRANALRDESVPFLLIGPSDGDCRHRFRGRCVDLVFAWRRWQYGDLGGHGP
jgi:hypothetical protein